MRSMSEAHRVNCAVLSSVNYREVNKCVGSECGNTAVQSVYVHALRQAMSLKDRSLTKATCESIP